MATKRKTTTRVPMSAAAKAARKALIQADLMSLEAGQARVAGLAKGAYGSPVLRSAGSAISSRYLLSGKGTSGAAPKKKARRKK